MSTDGLIYVNQPLVINITILYDLRTATAFKILVKSPVGSPTEYTATLVAGATETSGVVTTTIPEDALSIAGGYVAWCKIQLESGEYYYASGRGGQFTVHTEGN